MGVERPRDAGQESAEREDHDQVARAVDAAARGRRGAHAQRHQGPPGARAGEVPAHPGEDGADRDQEVIILEVGRQLIPGEFGPGHGHAGTAAGEAFPFVQDLLDEEREAERRDGEIVAPEA